MYTRIYRHSQILDQEIAINKGTSKGSLKNIDKISLAINDRLKAL